MRWHNPGYFIWSKNCISSESGSDIAFKFGIGLITANWRAIASLECFKRTLYPFSLALASSMSCEFTPANCNPICHGTSRAPELSERGHCFLRAPCMMSCILGFYTATYRIPFRCWTVPRYRPTETICIISNTNTLALEDSYNIHETLVQLYPKRHLFTPIRFDHKDEYKMWMTFFDIKYDTSGVMLKQMLLKSMY